MQEEQCHTLRLRSPNGMKALKCKTLGRIHMQAFTPHIEQQVPRTFYSYVPHTQLYTIGRLCIYCACAYECPRRPSPVSR